MALIPWWIRYPNVNDEIMNLDWLLRVSNENTAKISNFINLNTIKYADPILWDITSQYEANTITVDPQTGDAYISTKAVPYGVTLSNTDYWTKIYNYANEMDELREQIAAANEELSTTASAPRVVGDLVWLNGLIYEVTAPMIAGDSYVVGSNCKKITIEELLDASSEAIETEAEARAEADTALGQRIDDESEARAEAVQREQTWRENADTSLQNQLNLINNLAGKKILVAGDSLSNEEVNPPNWVAKFREKMQTLSSTVTNISFGGSSWCDGSAANSGMAYLLTQTDLSEYDILIIEEGTNDCTGQKPLGSWSSQTRDTFCGAFWEVASHIADVNPRLDVYFIVPPKRSLSNSTYPTPKPLNLYRSAIRTMCNYFNWKMIDWNNGLNNLNPLLTDIKNASMSDGIHINSSFALTAANYVIAKILSGGDTDIGNVLNQCEYNTFISSNVTGSIKLNYDTHSNIQFEIAVTVASGTTGAQELFSLESEAWGSYSLPRYISNHGVIYEIGVISNKFYLIPHATLSSNDVVQFVCIKPIDTLSTRGSFSL